MKIADVEAIPIAYPEPNDFNAIRHVCLVRIRADDGTVGWGEAVTMWEEASLATAAIISGMAELMIGQNPAGQWRHSEPPLRPSLVGTATKEGSPASLSLLSTSRCGI
ncbi:MAG: hypothetical protein KatS3mg011_1767 [Acidimicrobiia bacterium]|nr:MAG: hypothetical protein KatS3mg011_1767 [Acidimicrobiia bacterium]